MKNLENQCKAMRDTIVDMSVEAWRFAKAYDNIRNKLSEKEQNKYNGQLLWFRNSIEKNLRNFKINIVNLENEIFDIGMSVSPLNIDDFAEDEKLIVDQMLEPIIVSEGVVLHSGTVILRKA